MLRAPLTRAILPRSSALLNAARTSTSTPAKAPEKIEVFIDDQPVLVPPGTTVLQVTKDPNQNSNNTHIFLLNSRLPLKWVWKFPVFAIMKD